MDFASSEKTRVSVEFARKAKEAKVEDPMTRG
jgi:hypothetical protein